MVELYEFHKQRAYNITTIIHSAILLYFILKYITSHAVNTFRVFLAQFYLFCHYYCFLYEKRKKKYDSGIIFYFYFTSMQSSHCTGICISVPRMVQNLVIMTIWLITIIKSRTYDPCKIFKNIVLVHCKFASLASIYIRNFYFKPELSVENFLI